MRLAGGGRRERNCQVVSGGFRRRRSIIAELEERKEREVVRVSVSASASGRDIKKIGHHLIFKSVCIQYV